jgi:hypothetical protein
MIGDEQDRAASPLFAFTKVVSGGLARWMVATHTASVKPLNAKAARAADAPSIKVAGFAFADSATGPGPTFAAMALAGTRGLRNPVVADYLMTARH